MKLQAVAAILVISLLCLEVKGNEGSQSSEEGNKDESQTEGGEKESQSSEERNKDESQTEGGEKKKHPEGGKPSPNCDCRHFRLPQRPYEKAKKSPEYLRQQRPEEREFRGKVAELLAPLVKKLKSKEAETLHENVEQQRPEEVQFREKGAEGAEHVVGAPERVGVVVEPEAKEGESLSDGGW